MGNILCNNVADEKANSTISCFKDAPGLRYSIKADLENKKLYCPCVPTLGMITAENRQKYPTISYLVFCSVKPKFT